MRVKSKKIQDKNTSEILKSTEFLTADKEYIVLEVEMEPNREAKYRIISDNGTPILEKSSQFEITEPNYPSIWSEVKHEDGCVTFSPLSWQKPGFWESYFNYDPNALEIYERELKKIMEES